MQRVMKLVGLNAETTLVSGDGVGLIFPLQYKRKFLFVIDAKNPSKLVPQIIVYNDDGIERLSIEQVRKSTNSRRIKKTFVVNDSSQDTKAVIHFSASCIKK